VEKERAAEAAAERERHERIHRGIPWEFRGADFADFDPSEIAPIVEWVKKPEGFIVISGGVGVGKSHLACAAMKHFNAEGHETCLMVDCENLIPLVRKSYGKYSSTDAETLIDRYAPPEEKNRNIVIFDDLGAGEGGEHAVTTWFRIMKRRRTNGHPTIITTNLTSEELAKALGDRTASRILSGVKIKLSGNDRRLEEAKHWTDIYN
jgi:DNA replication protein DnaC